MNLVAIGGGDMGAGATLPLDRQLVELTDVARPRMLFIPTASEDSLEYVARFNETYAGMLNCDTDSLLLWSKDRDADTIRRKIDAADGIYVGGGNTKAMIQLWRELGVDRMLKAHLDAGKPAGGLSAGALCWFRLANSDWPQYEGIEGVNTASLECLGFVDLVVCPHTRDEGFRLREFSEMLEGTNDLGLGLDDCCAIQIRDSEYRILASEPFSFAHKLWWEGGTCQEQLLLPHEDFRPLALLQSQ